MEEAEAQDTAVPRGGGGTGREDDHTQNDWKKA